MWMVLFFCLLAVLIVVLMIANHKMTKYKELVISLQDRVEKTMQELDAKTNENVSLTQNVQELTQKNIDNKIEIDNWQQQYQELDESKNALEKEYTEKENAFNKNIEQKDFNSKEMKNLLQAQINALNNENNKKQDMLQQNTSLIEELKTNFSLLEIEYKKDKEKMNSIESEMKELEQQIQVKEELGVTKDQEIVSLIHKRNEEQQQLMRQIQDRDNKMEELRKKLDKEIILHEEKEKAVSEMRELYQKNLERRDIALSEISRLLQRLTSLPLPDKIMNINLKNTRKFTLEGNLKKEVLVHEQKKKEQEALYELRKHLQDRDDKMAKYLEVLQTLEEKIQKKIDRSQGVIATI